MKAGLTCIGKPTISITPEQAEMQTRFVAGMDHIWEGQRPLIWFDYINRMGPLPGELMDRQARDWFTFQAKIKHRIYTLLDERAETSQLRMFEISDVGFSIQDYVDRWNPDGFELKTLKSYWRLIDGAWHSCAMANLMWKRSGKNVVVIESQLQKMFEHTSLNILPSDIPLVEGESVYIALPGFDGQVYDRESGYHALRGIWVCRNNDRLAIGHWGKPKLESAEHIGVHYRVWSDTFMTSWLNLKPQDAEETVEALYERMMDSTHEQLSGPFAGEDFNLDEETKRANMVSMRIAINTLLYWKENQMEHVHPLVKRYHEQLADMEKMKNKKRTKRKQRRFDRDFEKITEKAESMRGWFFIDPPEIKRSSRPVSDSDSEDASGRKSPHSHIRRGHHRRYKGGKTIWIKPMIIGGSGEVPTKWWKSKLDGVV